MNGINPNVMELVGITTPDGKVFEFFDRHNRWTLNSEPDSAGFPDMEFLSFTPYKGNRDQYLDYRLRRRNLGITYRTQTASRDEYWTARAELLNILRPNRTLLVGEDGQSALHFQLGDGTIYKIKVLTSDPIFEDRDEADPFGYTVTLGFICMNPVWYANEISTFLADYASAAELIFPIQFDNDNIWFGEEGQIFEGDLIYNGTWRSFPVITAIGPFDYLQLEQVDTSAVLLVNAPVNTNEQLIIDIDNQTVGRYEPVASGGALIDDYLPFVSPDSDFINWYIAPDAIAPDGANTIKIIAPSALAGTTQVTFSYLNRYIGI